MKIIPLLESTAMAAGYSTGFVTISERRIDSVGDIATGHRRIDYKEVFVADSHQCARSDIACNGACDFLYSSGDVVIVAHGYHKHIGAVGCHFCGVESYLQLLHLFPGCHIHHAHTAVDVAVHPVIAVGVRHIESPVGCECHLFGIRAYGERFLDSHAHSIYTCHMSAVEARINLSCRSSEFARFTGSCRWHDTGFDFQSSRVNNPYDIGVEYGDIHFCSVYERALWCVANLHAVAGKECLLGSRAFLYVDCRYRTRHVHSLHAIIDNIDTRSSIHRHRGFGIVGAGSGRKQWQ